MLPLAEHPVPSLRFTVVNSLINADPRAHSRIMAPSSSDMRHCDYYFEDGNLIIQVERTLFNVFRSTFTTHSRVFKDVFALPKPVAVDGYIVEGSSDGDPLRLPGISSIDFERLLWILYPPAFGVHKAHTVDEWTSILHLGTRWEFDDIRALAIRELERHSVNPIDKIVLSREFNIRTRWTLSAYTALCEREKPITMQEAQALGLELTVRISQLRHQLHAGPWRRKTYPVGAAHQHGRAKAPADSSSEDLRGGTGKRGVIGGPSERRYPGSPKKLPDTAPRLSDTSRLVAHAFGLLDIEDAH